MMKSVQSQLTELITFASSMPSRLRTLRSTITETVSELDNYVQQMSALERNKYPASIAMAFPDLSVYLSTKLNVAFERLRSNLEESCSQWMEIVDAFNVKLLAFSDMVADTKLIVDNSDIACKLTEDTASSFSTVSWLLHLSELQRVLIVDLTLFHLILQRYSTPKLHVKTEVPESLYSLDMLAGLYPFISCYLEFVT